VTDRLISLFHRRWAVPLLAELHRLRGAKFVTLVNRLGASAGSVRQTLGHLIEHGLVKRNPGYGHPLRPEYLLTGDGAQVGPACSRLAEQIEARDLADMALRKWSMPILHALGGGAMRFAALRESLPGVTDRALTLGLKDLLGSDLVERAVVDEFPPTTEYRARPSARGFLTLLRQLESALRETAAS
jgi:DNA-binding HxlR family transcriptional regulator